VKKTFYIIVFLLATLDVFAQDPQFTQFYANPLYLAPSFAGATVQNNRVATAIRDQWTSIYVPGTFITSTLSYDHYFSNFNSGVGVILMRDQAGSVELNHTSFGILYSFDFAINDYIRCSPGVQLKYFTESINKNKLLFFDQLQSGSSTSQDLANLNMKKKSDIDFEVSALFYTDKIWVGLNADHLRRPERNLITREKTQLEWSLFGGYTFYRKLRLLKPVDESLSFIYVYKKQGKSNQLDIGAYWKKEPIVMGFLYRGIPFVNSSRGDAVALLAGFKIDEKLYIGYSYDITISNLTGGGLGSGGAHEIAVTYEFKTKQKQKIRQVPCPHP
jgi:type IX secretion system PorP/SprF family membrane protein